MPNRSPDDVSARRIAIIDLIAANPLPVEDVVRQLRPKAAKRTVYEDLEWLLETFPHHLKREGAGKAHGKYRVTYRWLGNSPYLLDKPITWLTEEELISLVAARGFLRDSTPDQPPTNTTLSDQDLLAGAIAHLIDRAGVQDAAEVLARQVLTVSRFGAAPCHAHDLAVCLAATATGESLHFDYENLQGRCRRIHAVPQRCVLVKGEWYLIAWAGDMHNFRLSRMASVSRTKHAPKDAPSSIPTHQVDALLENGFCATCSSKPKDRARVQLAVSPQAWPHIRDRRWGDNQVLAEEPTDLPPRLAPPHLHHHRPGRMPALGPGHGGIRPRRGPGTPGHLDPRPDPSAPAVPGGHGMIAAQSAIIGDTLVIDDASHSTQANPNRAEWHRVEPIDRSPRAPKLFFPRPPAFEVEPPSMQDRWLSVEEIAEYLGVSKDTVYTWVTAKRMPGHKVGRLWKFKCDEIDAWVRDGGAGDDREGEHAPAQ